VIIFIAAILWVRYSHKISKKNLFILTAISKLKKKDLARLV
jgi:hypothetical protein